jgi:uncharacterized protein (TIGR02186 family)
MTGRTFLLALTLLLATMPARSQDLVADLSNHLVAVTTGFAGTSLLLFGATQGEGDVVVVVRGPDRSETVRRKRRTLGLWVNRDSYAFAAVPSFYHVASSRPLKDIVSEQARRRLELGVETLRLPAQPRQDPDRRPENREALIRQKQKLGLFPQAEGRVAFLGPRLFRTDVMFPSNVPTGDYTVTVYLVRDQEITTAQTTPLIVSKLGFSARVSDFALQHGALHGVFAVALSMVAGLAAGIVLRKV